MKRISKRMLFLLGLMGILLVGLCLFMLEYTVKAKQWALFPGSPHLYSRGNLSAGVITDRKDEVLLSTENGKNYAEDPALRASVMHLLGDRYGYISSPMMRHHAENMVGFSRVNGLYETLRAPRQMTMTIDAEVQKAALAELDGRKGTIGVYNYKTGEILCAVTAPSYDPDNMPDVQGDVTGAYEGAYMHRFFQMTYVPGSIYKIVTTAAALEEIPDIANRRFYCGGSCQIGADTVNCNGTHHSQTLAQALANSCNVAFAELAVELGEDTLLAYADRFGVMDSLNVDGILTAPGKIDLETAAESEIAWSGIGQYTNLVNPCQFMTLMGAIAGDGEGAKPYLVKEVDGSFGSGYKAKTKTFDIDLSKETCDILAGYMKNNVVSMYGQWLFPNLYICAKSGTAELGPEQTPHATFAGFVDDANYPLAFIVIVENGGSGSATCAPIAGRVLTACCNAMDAERS